MKNFFSAIWAFLKSAWFLWTLLLVVLVLLVWFGGAYLAFFKDYRLVTILILVVLWGLNNLRLQYQKATKIAQENNSHYSPEQLAMALQALGKSFRQALRSLPAWDWLKFKSQSLPWYLTLGMPGSGKTAALLHSNLSFPIELNDPKLEGDYLTWRYSLAATFLDLKGSLVAHERETDNLPKQVWEALLKAIRRYRYRKSFEGIILSIDLEILINVSEESLALQAYTLSQCLKDLDSCMGFQCPVYIQVTKLDQLNGFKEFCDLLTTEERQQVMGFSLKRSANPLPLFSEQFNAFIDQLLTKVLFGLRAEKVLQKAATASLFPSELQGIKKRLERFLGLLFESSPYREASYFRGLAFTSALFEEKVQQHLLKPYILEFGHKLRAPNYLINARPDELLHAFYKQFILADKPFIYLSRLQRQQLILRNSYIAGAAGLVLLGLIYAWSVSYMANTERLSHLNNDIQDYLHAVKTAGSNLEQRKSQLALLDEMQSVFDPEEDPGFLHRGLYQGNKMMDTFKTLYDPVLQYQFLPVLLNDLKSGITNPTTELGQVYELLRAYLMLGDEKRLEPHFFYNVMDRYWDKSYGDNSDLKDLMLDTLNSYLKYKSAAIQLEPDVIQAGRRRLENLSLADQVYSQLSNGMTGESYSVVSGSAPEFNHVFQDISGMTQIPLLFTLRGYQEIYSAKLSDLMSNLQDSDWVLGREQKTVVSDSEKSAIQERVKTLYMNQYVTVWRNALFSLKVIPFKTLSEARTLLDVLSEDNSPLEKILKSLNQNTILLPGDKQPPPTAIKIKLDTKKTANAALRGKSSLRSLTSANQVVNNADKIAGIAKNAVGNKERTAVGSAFYDFNQLTLQPSTGGTTGEENGTLADEIYGALADLDAYVTRLLSDPDINKAAYAAAVARMQSGSGDKAASAEDPIGALINIANQMPSPLRSWLNDIAQNTWRAVLNSAAAYINQQWELSVYPDYQSIISSYPFSKQSASELDMTQFAAFLGKEGALDKFVTTYLAPFVNLNASPWQLNVVSGSSLPIGLNALYQWAQLRQAFFGKGDGKQITIPFSVASAKLDNSAFMAQLTVSDKSVSVFHGPQTPEELVWIPDSNGSATLQITLTNESVTNLVKNGAWAWFRLLDTAEISPGTTSSIMVVKFNLYGTTVIYTLKSATPINPFNLPRLRTLSLPRSL